MFTLYNSVHELKLSKLDIQIHVEHLSSLEVIERCDKEEVDRFNQRLGNVRPIERSFKKLNFYQRTYLGDGIHSFLSKAKP